MAVITPDRFNPMLQRVGVRLAQGVPIVDADWNELEDTRRFEMRAFVKWFIGDGIPAGNNGFQIVPVTGLGSPNNNFTIARGMDPPPPLPVPQPVDLEKGLRHIGRCIVDGLDIIITEDLEFTAQPLHVSQAGSAALAAAWGVPVISPLPTLAADGRYVVYVDHWERLLTPSEVPTLVLPGLGVESCSRLKREWVVRVRDFAAAADPLDPRTFVPRPGDADFVIDASGRHHSYYALATIARRAGVAAVAAGDITDWREQQLQLMPATLIEDLFGAGAAAYRRGRGRPPISFRAAVNALLRGELPSTPDTAIAPDPAQDFMSYAFGFDPAGGVIAVWQSERTANPPQILATRWDPLNPGGGFATPPQQVTVGPQAHELPHAVVLPTGDVLVVYQTAGQDIHFKRAPLSGLNAAAQQPVATTADPELHPHVVVSGNVVWFFWHRGGATPRWVYRRRQYPADWSEAAAVWADAVAQEIPVAIPAEAPAAPSTFLGDFHAAVDGAGNIWIAFRTLANDIRALELTPAGVVLNPQILSTAGTDQEAFVVVDGTAAVWVFWRSDAGVQSQRFLLSTSTWEAAATLVPETSVGAAGTNTRPVAVRDGDGGIWLFWVSQRGGPQNDLWFVRRNPTTGGWGAPRQVTGAAGSDTQPFVTVAPNGVLWLFWRSNRGAVTFDLFFKQIVTAL
jgi:hypothetical protein